MKTLILGIVLLLAGCATTEQYARNMDTWLGSSSTDLVRKLGPPTSTFKMEDGNTIYTYAYNGGTNVYNNGYYLQAVSSTCVTDFTIDKLGKVIDWRFQGNACRARN